MRKKTICIILALMFCLGLSLPAFASGQTSQLGFIPHAPNIHTASSWARNDISLAVYMGLVPPELQDTYMRKPPAQSLPHWLWRCMNANSAQ